jgi:hypothetical protein
MANRFSIKAFILATVVHFAGMVALLDASFRVIRGSEPAPVWLTVVSWIWESVPMAISHLIPRLVLVHFYFVIIWSFVVGAIVGFIVPRVSRVDRQQSHLTNR